MPVYEYECTKCGDIIEVFQMINEKPLTKCEQCKGKVRKLISHSTFRLKGTGWYVTDYASKSGGNQGGTSNQQSKDKKETKSDSTATEKKASSSGDKTSEKKV